MHIDTTQAMRAQTNIEVSKLTLACIHTDTYTGTQARAYTDAYTQTHTQVHRYAHTHTDSRHTHQKRAKFLTNQPPSL